MFKPRTSNSSSNTDFKPRPVPKQGLRYARVSLIVDLGKQEREPDKETGKEFKPVHQVAIFSDLVNDIVDYGDGIGKAQYRYMYNYEFKGELDGISFQAVSPQDENGVFIADQPKRFAPTGTLSKLCRAVERPDIAIDDPKNPDSLVISKLLNLPHMIEISIESKPDSKGRLDSDGKPLVFTNVKCKALTSVMKDEDDNPVPVKPLQTPAKCITFDNATMEDIKILRKSVILKIKKALDYEGSQMEKAIQEYEKKFGVVQLGNKQNDGNSTKDKQSNPEQSITKERDGEDTDLETMEDDIPF